RTRRSSGLLRGSADWRSYALRSRGRHCRGPRGCRTPLWRCCPLSRGRRRAAQRVDALLQQVSELEAKVKSATLRRAGASAISWPLPPTASLETAGRLVVRFDNRDIGLSSHIDYAIAPYTLDDMATDTLRPPRRARHPPSPPDGRVSG